MFFPNRRAALAYLALLLPPMLMTLMAFVTLARVDEANMVFGTPLDATLVPPASALAQAQNLFETGVAEQARGDFAAAEQAYQAALDIDPTLAPVYNALGGLFVAWEQPSDAVAFYRQAVRLEPQSAEWQRNLGVVQANLGHMDAAVAALEAATRLDPGSASLFYELGQVYAHLQRFESARSAFGRVLELDSGGMLADDAAEQLRNMPARP